VELTYSMLHCKPFYVHACSVSYVYIVILWFYIPLLTICCVFNWIWRWILHMMMSDYGVTSYDIGTGFGHFAIATPDVSYSLLSQKLDNLLATFILKLKYVFHC
jgi:hypothetical protein